MQSFILYSEHVSSTMNHGVEGPPKSGEKISMTTASKFKTQVEQLKRVEEQEGIRQCNQDKSRRFRRKGKSMWVWTSVGGLSGGGAL